jgi:hypothetical protein
MKMQKVREKIFDLYSQNLEMIINQDGLPISLPFPAYICPLCKGVFPKDAIMSHDKESELTVEHIPPKSVGSKEIVLTCKNCNNTHGSKLDSHLSGKLKGGKFLSMTPGEEIQAEFEVNGNIPARGYIKISNSGSVEVFFDGKRTNQKYEKQLIDFVTSDSNKKKLKMTFTTHNRRLAKLSILRSAYLWAFCRLGYAFIFSKGAERIRQLIENHQEANDIPMVLENGVGDSLLGMHIVLAPKELRGYLIGMKINEGNFSQNIAVFLPGAYLNDSIFFDYIAAVSKEKRTNFQYTQIPKIDFLRDEKYVLTPVNMWGG